MSVYFITCRQANAVKIGHSIDPHARMQEIQVGCPLPVRLEAEIPGGPCEERALHQRLDGLRLRGEWFQINPLVEALIANPSLEVSVTLPARRVLSPRETVEDNERIIRELGWKEGERRLRKRLARGDIHFPFRGMTLVSMGSKAA